jgi:hypothetical protein
VVEEEGRLLPLLARPEEVEAREVESSSESGTTIDSSPSSSAEDSTLEQIANGSDTRYIVLKYCAFKMFHKPFKTI